MRRHAGAVILLGGWLLMAAPMVGPDRAHQTADTDAPLTRWKQVEAFDTARACEDELATAPQFHASVVAFHWSYKCVPAESVYPPQPTAPK